MKIWTVEHRHLTSGKFPFRIFGQRMGVSVNRCHVGVQYLGEGCLSWTDVGVKGCQGVRDAKESPVVSVCEMVSSFLQEM